MGRTVVVTSDVDDYLLAHPAPAAGPAPAMPAGHDHAAPMKKWTATRSTVLPPRLRCSPPVDQPQHLRFVDYRHCERPRLLPLHARLRCHDDVVRARPHARAIFPPAAPRFAAACARGSVGNVPVNPNVFLANALPPAPLPPAGRSPTATSSATPTQWRGYAKCAAARTPADAPARPGRFPPALHPLNPRSLPDDTSRGRTRRFARRPA